MRAEAPAITTVIVALLATIAVPFVLEPPLLDKLLTASIVTAVLSAIAFFLAKGRPMRLVSVTVILLVVAFFLFVIIRSIN